MFITAAAGTLIAVNLGCACVALAVGFAAGVWFFGGTELDAGPDAKKDPKAKQNALLATERAVMASSRLKDLASGIASEVDLHSLVVGEFNDAIHHASDHGSPAANAALGQAMNKMVEANAHLQERLAVAEQQIEAQAAEIQSHQSEARTDSLTGLANRRAFDCELGRRISEWQRKGTPLTLSILDIDFFKKFNDKHGHQAGDEVLRHVGQKLTEATREMDIPCRYGGEEFAVIMPATSAKDGAMVAERIRTMIEKSAISFEGKSLRVTASIGLTQIGKGDDGRELIKRADDALYKSKEAGRNCGHLHRGDSIISITPGRETSVEKQPTPTPAPAPVPAAAPNSKKLLDRMPDENSFADELRRRIAESHRFGVPLSMLHLQVDDFGSIVSRCEPAAVKAVLDSIAQFITNALREMDLLARGGNGQFAVMLPGSAQNEAAQVADRIDAALSRCVIPVGGDELQLRISHGIAEAAKSDTAQELMARARTAMLSKRSAEPQLVEA